MPYIGADAFDLLRQLAADVAELKRLVLDSRRGIVTGSDAALVAAVFAVAGRRQFSARELSSMAQRPGLPEAVLLDLLGARSPKAIGRALLNASGRPCADTGLVLIRTPGRLGATWRVSDATKAARS